MRYSNYPRSSVHSVKMIIPGEWKMTVQIIVIYDYLNM